MTLDRQRLAAVAAIWKRQRRRIVARFGGTSMLPSIPPETELLIDCGREPQTGDVVLAATEVGLIVHRLIAVRGDRGVMRGDGAAIPDPAVPMTDIFGVAMKKREASEWIDIPPSPRSVLRRVFGALARVSLRFGDGVNQRLSGLLWLGRRAVTANSAVAVEDDGQRDQPERQ